MVRQSMKACLGAVLATCVFVACSSFGSSSAPPGGTDDAGEGGAVLEGGSAEATACTNVDTDPANCGRCGHGCQGGACTAGRCQPMELARFTDEPTANVVLTRTHVYWNTMESLAGGPGKVFSCAKTGCSGAPTVVQGTGVVIRGLGSDGDQRAYGGAFYAGGGLSELAPSVMTPRLDVATGGFPFQMSVRPEALYYVAFYEGGDGLTRTVRRWDYKGTITTPCTFATGGNTTAAAFTTSRVYLHSNSTGVLHSCPLVGPSGQFTVHRDNLYLASITATADRVFWADNGLVTSSPDGAAGTSLRAEVGASDLGSKATSVTVTGGDLLITTEGGELWSCAPNDCAKTLQKVAKETRLETFHPLVSHTVAADADAVYYVAVETTADGGRGGSRLMKVAR